jgi:hypothetical protein
MLERRFLDRRFHLHARTREHGLFKFVGHGRSCGQVDIGVDLPHLGRDVCRSIRLAGFQQGPVRDPELVDRFREALMGDHLVRHRQPEIDLPRRHVTELDQRPERLIQIPALLHPLGVDEEARAGIGDEALLRPDLSNPQVDLIPVRHVSDDLLADRDGVVF